jgi:hypothetical protein
MGCSISTCVSLVCLLAHQYHLQAHNTGLYKVFWAAGKPEAYSGEAVNPENLSWYEGLRKTNRHYVPEHANSDPVDLELVTAPTVTASDTPKRIRRAWIPFSGINRKPKNVAAGTGDL